MNKIKQFIKLVRPQHYIKNILIATPFIFAGMPISEKNVALLLEGFICFSIVASIVYIINDIKDVEKDRQHEIKCKRPIASGQISVKEATVLGIILLILSQFMIYSICKSLMCIPNLILWLYIILNLLYSIGLKEIPICDVVILASGFVLRVIYGAYIFGIVISPWFYLTIMMFSLYMGLGKRRNELRKMNGSDTTRKVLKYYTDAFLSRNMLMSMTLGLVFYSFWSAIVSENNQYTIWSVPLVLIIIMKYELDIEGDSFGDPVDVILNDKLLIVLVLIYGITMLCLLYA